MCDIQMMEVGRSKSPGGLDSEYLKSISTLNDGVVSGAVRDEDWNSALSLLIQLQASIRAGQYGTFSSSRKHEHYHLFVCHYNLALLHQRRQDNARARISLEKAVASYERMQGFITQREETVVFMTQLARVQLQLCGLLSHCDLHMQAAALAQKSVDRIAETARILQAVCYEQALLSAQSQTTCSSREKGGRSERVDFKAVVIAQAQTLLQRLGQLAPPHRLLEDEKPHFLKIISKIYGWRENQGKGEAALRRQLGIPSQKSSRNLLGLQRPSFQPDYEIGGLMTLEFRNIAYKPHPDPLRLLSAQSLRQLAFCAAVGYFTVATESRFGEADLSDIRGNMRIDEKFRRLNHDERLIKCKILHLKALQTSGKLLPPGNALFSHLVQSFTRNYQFQMDEIHQVSEPNSTQIIKELPIRDQANILTEYGIKTSRPKLERNRLDSNSRKGSKQKPSRSKSNTRK